MPRLEIECLKTLPLPVETVKGIFDERHNWDGTTRDIISRLCLSHERLRAELSGAEIIITELETKCQEKL